MNYYAKYFYYASKFKEFVNGVKLTFDDLRYDESRIIIPLYYRKELIGIQGRSLDFKNPKSIKYITKEACLRFALSATRTYGDAASFLGMNESDLRKEIKKFKIDFPMLNILI